MKAVYPGSFDPVTNGHLDIICRAQEIFGELTIAVLNNDRKQTLFTPEERIDMLEKCIGDKAGIEIVSFSGLLVDFLKKNGGKIAIRGMRAVSDFDYEYQMALTNKGLYSSMETVFLVTKGEYAFISSSLVKEICRHGGNISGLVPDYVMQKMIRKLS